MEKSKNRIECKTKLSKKMLSLTVFAGLAGIFLLAGAAVPSIWAENTNFFLHGLGPNSNPPRLFLDNTNPTGTTSKYKDSPGIKFSGGMVVHVNGDISYETGLAITLWDGDDCWAYWYGASSAIVTGPGLPAEGTKLYHMYPLPYFRLYPYDSMNPGGNWYVLLDDDTIRTIPDGADYTIRLYSEPADTVSLANTPLTSFVKTNPRRPLLSTELNTSLFPTLLTPVTHKSSELNIGGLIEVSWTNPANMKVRYMNLGLATPSGQFTDLVSTDVTPGETSANLDTTAFPGYRAGQLFLTGSDDYARSFSLMWRFDPWQ